MEKDFDAWNVRKKLINSLEKEARIADREVWWCALGINIGAEEDGKNELFERPVLIFKIFNDDLIWIVPLTTKHKMGPYYYSFIYGAKEYTVILSQLRIISTKRLSTKIYTMPGKFFLVIREKLRILI